MHRVEVGREDLFFSKFRALFLGQPGVFMLMAGQDGKRAVERADVWWCHIIWGLWRIFQIQPSEAVMPDNFPNQVRTVVWVFLICSSIRLSSLHSAAGSGLSVTRIKIRSKTGEILIILMLFLIMWSSRELRAI